MASMRSAQIQRIGPPTQSKRLRSALLLLSWLALLPMSACTAEMEGSTSEPATDFTFPSSPDAGPEASAPRVDAPSTPSPNGPSADAGDALSPSPDTRIDAATKADGSTSAVSPCATADAIFCVDHEDVPSGHHVTDADITRWFLADQSRAGITNDKTGGAIDIVPDPSGDPARGQVMRVFNSEGARGYTDGLNPPSAGQWRSWPGEHEALYFAFDMYMEPGRLWSKAQKLPGLLGGDWAAASGGTKGGAPDGTNGFSARLQMYSTLAFPGKGDGALAQYTYFTDTVQKNLWYDDGPGGQVNLEPGRWYTIETYLKVNTPGVANGIMRAWVDGVMVLERKNIVWRTVSSLKLDGVYFLFGYGGASDSFKAPEDQNNYYDNWILSTKPITH